MTLKYRGITYKISKTSTIIDTAIVEGKYHGIAMKISLPQVTPRIEELKTSVVYRGNKLAV